MSRRNFFIVSITAIALLALLAGCGQQEEATATAEMSTDGQTAGGQTVSLGIVDPVCAMEVDPQTAVKAEYQGQTYYFCSVDHHDQFMHHPDQYRHMMSGIDPVCGMKIDPQTALKTEYQGKTYHFCSTQCRDQFLQDATKYVSYKGMVDPVCGMKVDPKTAIQAGFEGKTYYFCSVECHEKFSANPKQYAYCKDHDRLHEGQQGHQAHCGRHGHVRSQQDGE